MRIVTPPARHRPSHHDDSWAAAAACVGLDVRVFFPDSGKTAGPARRVCGGCPVRAQCLQHALVAGERHGVWGGTTEEERRALRRQPTADGSSEVAA